MRDVEGNIVCGTMSNLFLRHGARLLTPRLDRGGVAGIMRRWVMETARAAGVSVEEGRVTRERVLSAEEMFMTNAVVGVRPGRAMGRGREAPGALRRARQRALFQRALGAHMKRRLWAAVLVAVLLAAPAAFLALEVRSLDQPVALAAPLQYRVPSGTSFARIANGLAAQGVVAHPKIWAWYARFKGLAGSVKAGEYEIRPGITPRELLDKMVSGQVLLHSFTIVDGWRVQDMLEAMRRNPDIAQTLPPSSVAEAGAAILVKLGAAGVDAEGQFLPETYRFIAGTPDTEVLRQAHAALTRELEDAWTGRDPSVPLHDARELLIMASIVEKESGIPQELGKIAGLYLHRLAIGMRLQADPTLIYGLGEHYDGDIHSVDLRTDGPYNTYTRSGLPPTPIALPSAAVLRATARPEQTDALYFVASSKGDGTHVFSATLEQHNAAVAAYVARQRQKAHESVH